ncbi:MAG: hypothetical protein FJX72_07540 [Armatimonadetes bacterium]|nr:hypothetical protein [Armatimonadota bacterium]
MTCALASCLLPLASSLAFADVARYAAGAPPTEDHVRLVRIAPIDGNPRGETHAGKPCLRTDREHGNPYIYLDVSRRWLKASGYEPYRVEATIEYFDEGVGNMAVQYDSMGNSVETNFREVAWAGTASGAWRKATVMLDDAEFRNGQQGRADLRIAASPGADLRLASIVLRVVAASNQPPAKATAQREAAATPPEPRLPKLDEVAIVVNDAAIVPVSGPNEAERIALERLRARLADIVQPTKVGVVATDRRFIVGRRTERPTLVIGRWRTDMAARHPRTAAAIRRLQSDPIAFRRRDGYVVCIERAGPNPIVCAVGLSSPGAVYAIGHLHSRLMRDGSSAILALSRRPVLEAPRLDRRELYLNIGYGLGRPGITSEFWTDEEWRRYIDHLVLARYNTWSFYLWADSGLIHPVAQANRELNVRLHERLRRAIAYSHRRGLRVGMQFSPSMLPVEVWNEKPAIRAKLEYHYPGTICPSHPESKPLMRDIHGTELRWFKDVDFYSIWFYDVGGCFCETCRAPEAQLASLLEQVRTFGDIAHEANPRATFQVMTWAIWRYEKRHGYSIRDRFVSEVVEWFRARGRPNVARAPYVPSVPSVPSSPPASRRQLEMADGIYVDPETKPLFDLIVREKVAAKAFLYQTNIETGQPFPILQTRYLARWAPASVRAGATSAFLMRMEAGTKLADDVVAGSYLWNPNVSAPHALLACARLVTGDVRASRTCWEALHRMDDFAWFGHAGGGAGAAQGAAIGRLTASAVKASPPSLQPRLEWLATAGEGYRILGQAVEARDDEDDEVVAKLDLEFSEAMRRSPQFRRQAEGAPYWKNLFKSDLVRYFYAGWRTYHF